MDFKHLTPNALEMQSALSQAKLMSAKSQLHASPANEKELRKTAEDFEAVFIAQLMSPMMDSVKTDELTGGGSAEGIFRSMMVTEVGKSVAARGGIGIADNVYRELLKLQEGS